MRRRTKKKLNIKKISIFIIPLILVVSLLLNLNNINIYILSKTTGYNEKTIATFIEKDIHKDIKNKEYSKTLEVIINTEYYNSKYLDSYLDIDYHEENNYLENINTLLTLGYSSTDINSIYQKLNSTSIDLLLEKEYFKDITNIINLSYFKEDYLERYLNYISDNELDHETAIIYVNIGLDNDYYTNVINIENQEDILVLVNKYNVLKSNYIPSDLETISTKYGGKQLRKEARTAFEAMCEGAKEDNINIYAGSGYRSYSYQQGLYNRYVAKDGKTVADTYSARAGYSEHQTGLAMDILNGSWNYISEEDKEYTWLINNSYKYGFILRYPKGKEDITGYMYEEWHFRYVGEEVAKEVYEANITYDEYIAKK